MVHSLLASLARLVTEASALVVTLSRVAGLLRQAIPFERLRVLRLDRADAVTLYAIRASGEDPTSWWGPMMRQVPAGSNPRARR